jgi:hypothetical protein
MAVLKLLKLKGVVEVERVRLMVQERSRVCCLKGSWKKLIEFLMNRQRRIRSNKPKKN